MDELAGSTAFVTGASQGIGEEIAVTLAEYGVNVALAARSDGIYETADRIDAPEQTLTVETDVTDEANVEESIAETIDTFGGLDILVNNAGIGGPTAPVGEIDADEFTQMTDVKVTGPFLYVGEIDADEFTQMTDVKVTGPFLCLKHSVDALRESDRGTVINIASIGGKRPYPNRTPYAASNMAMIGMNRTWAHELGSDDITVNTICPGPVEGPRIERVIEAQAEARDLPAETVREEEYFDDLALKEFIDPDNIAEMIAYLASDAGRQITAQDINIDSGGTWY